jgi:hypothetical protein
MAHSGLPSASQPQDRIRIYECLDEGKEMVSARVTPGTSYDHPTKSMVQRVHKFADVRG